MGMYQIAMPMFVGVNMGVFVGVLQADGKTTYTATAIFGGQTYTDTKIVTIPATGHITHVAEEKWRTDGTHHWKKCTGCDTKLESSKHTGETATCMEKAVCAVCEQPYGSEDPETIALPGIYRTIMLPARKMVPKLPSVTTAAVQRIPSPTGEANWDISLRMANASAVV